VTRVFAWLNGLVFVAIGLGFAVFVHEAARGLGISFSNPAGLGDFRAVYGGVQLALGASILFLAVRKSYRDAVTVGLLAVTGLATVRLISMALEPAAGALQWHLLAPELMGVLANALVLRFR